MASQQTQVKQIEFKAFNQAFDSEGITNKIIIVARVDIEDIAEIIAMVVAMDKIMDSGLPFKVITYFTTIINSIQLDRHLIE